MRLFVATIIAIASIMLILVLYKSFLVGDVSRAKISISNLDDVPLEVEEFIIKSAIPAAEMLSRKFGASTPIQSESESKIGKILNSVVYNHCVNELPHTGLDNIEDLFQVCNTACGGYAYVLRSLLAAYGIKTRYVNLYNLPQQGNHTMVEAWISPGNWALFDPTFGTFFSSTGDIGGMPLSLEEIRFHLGRNLSQHAFTSKHGYNFFGIKSNRLNVADMYENNAFNFSTMSVENYMLGEIAVPVSINTNNLAIAPLTLQLTLSDGEALFGAMNVKSVGEGVAAILSWTNDTLNKNIALSDDTSYLFHITGYNPPYFKSVNIINISGLETGKTYDLSISGISPDVETIQIVDIGRDIILNTIAPVELQEGPFNVQRKFRSFNENAQFLISIQDSNKGKAFIFGISVKEGKLN